MVTRAGKERVLAFLGRGAIVVEMIIDRLPRSACIVAVRPAILSVVSDVDFREFGEEHPQVYEALLTLLAARLRGTYTTIAAWAFLPPHGRVGVSRLSGYYCIENKAQLQKEVERLSLSFIRTHEPIFFSLRGGWRT